MNIKSDEKSFQKSTFNYLLNELLCIWSFQFFTKKKVPEQPTLPKNTMRTTSEREIDTQKGEEVLIELHGA